MSASLRDFLALVEAKRPADLVDVPRQVDPRYETAAIVTKLEERGRTPILRFADVKGFDRPMVTNVCGSMGRLALALGCGLKEVTRVYAERVQQPVAPRVVQDGACQEVVARGAEVDLHRLPHLVYHADDAAEPYITAATVIARDPDSGKTNLSYHRLMIAGRNRTGILMEKGRHLDGIYQRWRKRGEPMPIAVFVGAHPLWALGALYSGSPEVEELDVIGGLLGEPLDVVRTVSVPELVVPADTELVLEGYVSVTERIREGPFGEFTGYGTGVTETPVLQVQAVTHRRDWIFQDIVSGRMEHLILSMPALEHRTLRDARAVAPGVTKIALVAPLTSVVALDKADDDEPRRIIEALLGSDIYAKHVIVVDSDVEPSDLRQVMTAVALQTQADAKLHVLTGQQGTPLDPSVRAEDGKTAKMGVDATRPLAPARTFTRNRIPAEVLDRVDVSEFKKRK